MPPYLKELRDDTIMFYFKHKGLNGSQIALIFSMPRSTVNDIINKLSSDWTSSWSRIK